MLRRFRAAIVVGGLAALVASLLVLQYRETRRLKAQIANRGMAAATLGALRLENSRLKDQQTQWADNEEALQRLQAALTVVKKRIENAAKVAGKVYPSRAAGDFQPVQGWSDRGSGSPADALESSLAAAARGDVRRLATLIELGVEGRAELLRWLPRLPPSVRARYATPEDVVALFLARDVPLGGMQIKAQQQSTESEAILVVMFQDGQGSQTQRSVLVHRREGVWRLLLPSSNVNNYIVELMSKQSAADD